MKRPIKLKSQLIIYFTVITLVPSIFISWFYYINSEKTLEKNMIENASGTVAYIMDNIDKQLNQVEQMSDWIFINVALEKLMVVDLSSQERNVQNEWDFQDAVRSQLRNFAVGSYVDSALIEGNNGIDIRWGNGAAHIDRTGIQEKDWFKKQMAYRGKISWLGIVKNPSSYTFEDYIIPVARPIIHSYFNTNIGWSFIGFKEALISDVFKKYKTDSTLSIYVIDPNGICISHEDKKFLGKDMSHNPGIQNILAQKNGHFPIQQNKEKKLFVFHQSRMSGWVIIQELNYAMVENQKMILLKITLVICIASILVSIAFTVFLSHRMTKPLRQLQKRLKNISEGRFDRDASLEGEDEFGALGKRMNDMALDIQKLLDQLLNEEAKKRKLEISMLQSQINPHFLHNTLNTIKWMAIIQKADGVRDAVSALGRLLRNTICDAGEKVTIKEELGILDNYMYIQKLRYNGSVELEYRIEDESILDYQILKLTLQPIVENAIFHGIEPKKSAGVIRISFSQGKADIMICVEDDGVGMTADRINEIFSSSKNEGKLHGLSGVGIKNVDERIKLNYGKEYGIRIESIPGQYTKVYLRIPRENSVEYAVVGGRE